MLRQTHIRRICSMHPMRSMEMISTLRATQPSFFLKASQVHILRQPSDFYQTFLNMVRRAQKRIFISSLYIGNDEIELLHSLHSSLSSNPFLKLDISLDLLRCTRPGASTALSLLPLLDAFPDQVQIRLFRSPKLRGILANLVPRRFDEGWGTWHPKIYGVDDEVMISGANLNASYFTNRQDRYLLFNHPCLAEYCHMFLNTLANFSFRLLPPTTRSGAGYDLQWPNSQIHPHAISDVARQALQKFQRTYTLKNSSIESHSEVEIFPMIQSGPLGIREEERCLLLLLDNHATPEYTIDLTSGYFRLYNPYQERVISSEANWRIVAASPKANGFYGSSGVSGRIPEAYTLFESRFWKRVLEAHRDWKDGQGGVELREWERENWTYHAKGIWISPKSKGLPCTTVFGSTNLNSRSANLDTELSFIMTTTSDDLGRRLAEEMGGLRECSHSVGETTWMQPERKVRIGTKVLVAVVGDML